MTLLYYDPLFLEHETGNHPERAARIMPAASRLKLDSPREAGERPPWEPASSDVLQLAHDADYVDHIRRTCERGGGRLDPDTIVSARSFDVASLAAGAVIDAVDQVMTGDDRRAFCLLRPPGHHALRDRAMGFCLFNNVAVGALWAIREHQLDNVLIVDWDVHHGNGTQAIFWEDPRVGFLSIHRYPFYPGTGTADETGSGPGLGTKLNIPVPFGISRDDYFALFERGLEQLSGRIKPQLVIVSAGFDAHKLDPIGSLGLESGDFAHLTKSVVDVAGKYSKGRIVSVLEGGYHPEAVADSIDSHLLELGKSG